MGFQIQKIITCVFLMVLLSLTVCGITVDGYLGVDEYPQGSFRDGTYGVLYAHYVDENTANDGLYILNCWCEVPEALENREADSSNEFTWDVGNEGWRCRVYYVLDSQEQKQSQIEIARKVAGKTDYESLFTADPENPGSCPDGWKYAAAFHGCTHEGSNDEHFVWELFIPEKYVLPPKAPVAKALSVKGIVDADNNGYEPVALDGSSSTDEDGTIVSYVWTENGVQIGTGATPTITFSVGEHTVTLTVTDDSAIPLSGFCEITVEVVNGSSGEPIANAGYDIVVNDSDGNGSQLVPLDGSRSSDNGTITSYVWTENGAQKATGVTPSVNFTVGLHVVMLTVTDNDGLTDSDTVFVQVTPKIVPPPTTPCDPSVGQSSTPPATAFLSPGGYMTLGTYGLAPIVSIWAYPSYWPGPPPCK
jgi:hypothetical protein